MRGGPAFFTFTGWDGSTGLALRWNGNLLALGSLSFRVRLYCWCHQIMRIFFFEKKLLYLLWGNNARLLNY